MNLEERSDAHDPAERRSFEPNWPQGPASTRLDVVGTLGTLAITDGRREQAPVPSGVWYTAEQTGDGIAFDAGDALSGVSRSGGGYLWCDLLLDGDELCVFKLTLFEKTGGEARGRPKDHGADPPAFSLIFGLLAQVGARMRMSLEATSQGRWRYEREGAWLKPICSGSRVDLSKVRRIALTVFRKGDGPVRWCMSPLFASADAPPRLSQPTLCRGPLLDELGQYALRDWPGKSRTTRDVSRRLVKQAADADAYTWPADFARYGGYKAEQFGATGYFRTLHDGHRWWMVDPDGHPFWSAGVNCVRVDTEAAYEGLETALAWLPDARGEYADAYNRRIAGSRGPATVNYLAANLIRAFGKERWYDAWSKITLGWLRNFGFNTVANWSDWEIARRAGFPYVRTLAPTFPQTPNIFRDFPDVFHPNFDLDARAFAEPLEETRSDPALIGYFLMNEPTWGFATETPAAGMLFSGDSSHSRRALAEFLRQKYGDDAALAAAWGVRTNFAEVEEGPWPHAATALSLDAYRDLEGFSSILVRKLFDTLIDACRAVDAGHLNLGARYYTVPPEWALKGMGRFDVFSINCYRERIPHSAVEMLSKAIGAPVLIGEWHFGAHDVGLPASGIGRVKNQEDRGRAFRVYTEDAASNPWCVGVHYFTLYDQSAIGRFDGENYNIGFLDVCNRAYEPLEQAARASHGRLYQVAFGKAKPFADAPEYLPKLFL